MTLCNDTAKGSAKMACSSSTGSGTGNSIEEWAGISSAKPPVASDFGAARGHPYDRERPKPVPAAQVAHAVIRAVEGGRYEQYVPAYLRPAVTLRHLVPPLFRWGTKRSFARQIGEDRRRR